MYEMLTIRPSAPRSILDERIGDLALIEKSAMGQSAANSYPRCRFYSHLKFDEFLYKNDKIHSRTSLVFTIAFA